LLVKIGILASLKSNPLSHSYKEEKVGRAEGRRNWKTQIKTRVTFRNWGKKAEIGAEGSNLTKGETKKTKMAFAWKKGLKLPTLPQPRLTRKGG